MQDSDSAVFFAGFFKILIVKRGADFCVVALKVKIRRKKLMKSFFIGIFEDNFIFVLNNIHCFFEDNAVKGAVLPFYPAESLTAVNAQSDVEALDIFQNEVIFYRFYLHCLFLLKKPPFESACKN